MISFHLNCLPSKFNIPNIECILVLDEGKSLAWAGWESEVRMTINIIMLVDIKTENLEHLYGDRRNMWGLSWAT